MARTPITPVRIPLAEKERLEADAAELGVTLSDALRIGARMYLDALLATPHRRGRQLPQHRWERHTNPKGEKPEA